MAEIKGITFSNQAVTPKDDGQLHARLLSDGIISGCGMSYSAATFSLAAGYLIVAGRLMQIPATVYKAVDQATSGYARVLLEIDLTATATKTEFDQAQLAVEYSSTQNGFASLVQGDINGKDSAYQAVLAVMSLGTGGITQIISTIGAASTNIADGTIGLGALADDVTAVALGGAPTVHTHPYTQIGLTAAQVRTITVSSSSVTPSGGSNGDLWFRYKS